MLFPQPNSYPSIRKASPSLMKRTWVVLMMNSVTLSSLKIPSLKAPRVKSHYPKWFELTLFDIAGDFGRLRKVELLGPYSMWQRLCSQWAPKTTPDGNLMTPSDVYSKVRHLWFYFGINRVKYLPPFITISQDRFHDPNSLPLSPFSRLQSPCTL